MSLFDFHLEEGVPLLAQAREKHAAFCRKGLALDLSRGRPSQEQLDLVAPMTKVGQYLAPDGTDCRNYGSSLGLPALRDLWGSLLGVAPWRIVPGGSSSLALLYDALTRALLFGTTASSRPWREIKEPCLLCPTPGYDRHFRMGEVLGFRLIPVSMTEEGPLMSQVEELVKDPAVKGIFCVPKYANPTGVTYTEETVERLAAMETAAPDFTILWDNAYFCHDLYERGDILPDIFAHCERAGHPDRPLMVASTSKITFAGSGISVLVAGEGYLTHNRPLLEARRICPDQMNALRHLLFLKDKETVRELMQKHAACLRPRFEVLLSTLDREIGKTGIAEWTRPRGGYFVTLKLLIGSAKRVYALAKEAGVTLTPPGATHPYGVDREDAYLRLAPTSAPQETLPLACEVLANSIILAALESRFPTL